MIMRTQSKNTCFSSFEVSEFTTENRLFPDFLLSSMLLPRRHFCYVENFIDRNVFVCSSRNGDVHAWLTSHLYCIWGYFHFESLLFCQRWVVFIHCILYCSFITIFVLFLLFFFSIFGNVIFLFTECWTLSTKRSWNFIVWYVCLPIRYICCHPFSWLLLSGTYYMTVHNSSG